MYVIYTLSHVDNPPILGILIGVVLSLTDRHDRKPYILMLDTTMKHFKKQCVINTKITIPRGTIGKEREEEEEEGGMLSGGQWPPTHTGEKSGRDTSKVEEPRGGGGRGRQGGCQCCRK